MLTVLSSCFLQHGPYECLLNTVEACAIDAWPDLVIPLSSYTLLLITACQERVQNAPDRTALNHTTITRSQRILYQQIVVEHATVLYSHSSKLPAQIDNISAAFRSKCWVRFHSGSMCILSLMLLCAGRAFPFHLLRGGPGGEASVQGVGVLLPEAGA